MTSKGRVDAVVELSDKIYVFEFKFEKDAAAALRQIKERGYHERFLGKDKQLYLVGVSFSLDQKAVQDHRVKILS